MSEVSAVPAVQSQPPAQTQNQTSSRGRGSGARRGGRSRRGGPRPGPSGDTTARSEQPNGQINAGEALAPASTPASTSEHRGRGRRGGAGRGRGRGSSAAQASTIVSHRRFGGHLTSATDLSSAETEPALSADAPVFVPGQVIVSQRGAARNSVPRQAQPKSTPKVTVKSTAADLPTRIQEDIDNGQYECVICTIEVVRTSFIWSCNICWTVLHGHCVRKWHTNQSKNADPNADPAQVPTWRCPGCNSSLTEKPASYHCWCSKEANPKPIAGLPPHSCGQTCSKTRATCPHPCTLMCHAGPCPPCGLMGPTQSCFCGKHSSTKRCSETEYGKGWSCQETCGDLLPCGEHNCARPCHAGLCGACDAPVTATCYCGKEQKDVLCDQRNEIIGSFNYGQLESKATDEVNISDSHSGFFEGSFHCKTTCGRPYDCGSHTCEKDCHPQDEEAAHCPFSPDVISHCPCGKTRLDTLLTTPRESCQDPIPHCNQPCNKLLSCGHLCPHPCHTGPCSTCYQYSDMSCRCGRTQVKTVCHQGSYEPPMCFRSCKAQLNCGRHECGERCCPGERKAVERRKQKRSANENFEAEHICVQLCGRQLKCGKHTCQQLCHRGACPSCLEAVFDEISCSCGRTVLQPPQPCGTRPPECRFDCRKRPACGHPRVSHQCHPDDTPCTKCPFLVEKACICGKNNVKNQPCWFDEVRCGLPCGKKLKCGTHECKKLCHRPGECEDAGTSGTHCPQPCGKTRKSCDHVCIDQCHAPFACKEDIPCQSKAFITCPCQNRKQEVRCLATRVNSFASKHEPLTCDEECLRLQRNRRLAEALRIDPETHGDDHIPYSDATLKLFRDAQSIKWAQTQEREFRVFAEDREEKRLRFKPMSSPQRAFLHSLAEDYGLDSESMDPEPHRHVCIFKTPRFVSAPRKTLAQCVRIARDLDQQAQAAAAKPAVEKSTAFNAFLLKDARFGLLVDEVDETLRNDLAARPGLTAPALKFTTSFLPSDDILIKATPNMTAASIATSQAPTPAAVETHLSNLKTALAQTVARTKLAGSVLLCHADDAQKIVRREGDLGASAGGWSSVVSRGSWRRTAPAAPATQTKAPSSFVALRKKREEVRKILEQPVEDDWLAAAEKAEGVAQEDVQIDVKDEVQKEATGEAQGEAEGDETVAPPSQEVELVPASNRDSAPVVV